jgi:hypothetical protein
MPNEKCANCKFQIAMECHKNPPIAHFDATWPSVHAGDWHKKETKNGMEP